SNVKEKFGAAIEKRFRRACKVSTKQEFNKILQDIRRIKQSAFDYISAIPAENYAFYTQTSEYPKYGHSCSNISESAMSFFHEARKKPTLLAIEYIWHYIMNLFAKRREASQPFRDLTKFASYYYRQQREQAGHYACQRARRQRHNVDPPTPEHQSTNQESSEHEVGNHSDNEDTDASSLPSLNSLLRRPQPRPPSPSPQPFPQPPLQPSPSPLASPP